MTGWRAATASSTGSSASDGADVAPARREMGEVGQQIGFGYGRRGAANAACGFEDRVSQLGEEAFFDLDGSIVGGEDLALVFLQLGGRESLRIDQGLLALIVGWGEGQVRLRDFDVIAEDRVIADLERADAGALAFTFLNGRDLLAAGGGDGAQLVEFRHRHQRRWLRRRRALTVARQPAWWRCEQLHLRGCRGG